MARKANAEAITAEIKGPDYAGACSIMRDRVKAKKDQVSSVNGEISGLMDQVEKKGVNKIGARMFLALDGKEDHERKDILRTIIKLGEVAGWSDQGDMMDQAEGNNVVRMPSGGKSETAKSDGDDSQSEGDRLDPATFKSVVVERITAESDMNDAEAYPLADGIYKDLTTEEKGAMTRTLAVAKADELMADWETDPK